MNKILNYFYGFGKQLGGAFRKAVNSLQNKDVFVSVLIILVAFGSFGLGRMSKIEETKEPITIEDISENTLPVVPKNIQAAAIKTSPTSSQPTPAGQKFVASKNGTKYYLPWCSGVDRILEANKIWFATKEEAEGRGLTPAANCLGI